MKSAIARIAVGLSCPVLAHLAYAWSRPIYLAALSVAGLDTANGTVAEAFASIAASLVGLAALIGTAWIGITGGKDFVAKLQGQESTDD